MKTTSKRLLKGVAAALTIFLTGPAEAEPMGAAKAALRVAPRLYEDFFAYVRSELARASHAPSVFSFDGQAGAGAWITRLERGRYTAHLTGVGPTDARTSRGVVQVMAHAPARAALAMGHCTAGPAVLDHTGLRVDVICCDAAGQPRDQRFSVWFAGGGDRRGYVTAYNPTAPAYNVHPAYSHNSAMGVNTVTRLATGTYAATFPGLSSGGGNFQIGTLTQPAHRNRHCKVASWGGAPLKAYVLCFDLAGNLADAPFTAIYEESPIDFAGAFLWADQPLASSYTPRGGYRDSYFGGTPTVTRTAKGRYRVSLPNLTNQGITMVTAYGAGSERCSVVSTKEVWNETVPTLQVRVACRTAEDRPVDTRFTLKHRAE
jgi:hypothetical protein